MSDVSPIETVQIVSGLPVVTASTATPGVPLQVFKRSSTTRKYRCLIATARGARRRPHQQPHPVWSASLLRGRSLERLPSVTTLEQPQDLSKHRSRGNTSCQDPIVQPVVPRHLLFETTSLLP